MRSGLGSSGGHRRCLFRRSLPVLDGAWSDDCAIEQRHTGASQKDHEHKARYDPADMRAPGNAAAGIGQEHEKLLADPEGERNGGGERQGDAEKHEHPDPHLRVQEEIGGHDAGYGAGGADQRRLRGRLEEPMGQRSGGRAQKIEHEKTEMPERVLDIVAEDPEEKACSWRDA